MTDEIVKFIRKLMESLFVLLDGHPAWESIRNAFGSGSGSGSEFAPSLLFFGISFLLGLAGFLLFLILMRRGDRRKKNGAAGADTRSRGKK